jgi:hypothetical protein
MTAEYYRTQSGNAVVLRAPLGRVEAGLTCLNMAGQQRLIVLSGGAYCSASGAQRR